MAKTPFDYWKDLTQHKEELSEEGGYSPYMMTRFCSMVNALLPFSEEINRRDIPKDVHYELLKCFLPKRYIKFDYIKKKVEERDFKHVSKYFEFGSRDLKMALSIMTPDEIKKIKNKYGGLDK
jgi:hypothetical protein